uniref:Poxvirus Late Transcription Factor VLTF3 like n=1 Tax=Mimiviridae sp. ChoanoV1 TaxID=2596887 RepID=A0A5B8IPX4_9VIRU|nr:poxvirus Late Transcription Factor VLTF3 like [Mimiviridae sp. ChoanoV1]
MSFKVKNRKKKFIDTRTTIDAKHNKQMKEIKDKRNKLPLKKKELKKLKQKYSKFENVDLKTLSNEDFDCKHDLEDRIEIIYKEIKDLENNTEENEYLLKTANLLHEYYENDKKTSAPKKTQSNSKSVMDWLNKDAIMKNSKKDVCDQYLSLTEENFVKNFETQGEICEKCSGEQVIHLTKGCMICKKCGDISYIVIDSDKPSYKDPPKEVCYFAYKRINHFNEWLAQFQAKETTDIPKELYDQILLEIKKERIENMSKLTQGKIREILKKLKKNKYYEHVPHIMNKINGLPPPIMSRDTEEILRRMFKEIQIPFAKFCPKDRKNFLSYSYVLHKFVQLLDLDDFIDCFILLKSREKLHQQDLIWEKICEYLKWEFIPSV